MHVVQDMCKKKGEMIKSEISSIFLPSNPFTSSHTQANILFGAVQFKIEPDKGMYFPDPWLTNSPRLQ